MREIKRLTTLWMRKELSSKGETIWQDKFWEHTIRDEKDLQVHFDYIHYNPVKHELVETFDGWKWSSFRDYYSEGGNNIESIAPERFMKYKIGFGE